jgi:hypothetical protein
MTDTPPLSGLTGLAPVAKRGPEVVPKTNVLKAKARLAILGYRPSGN